MNNLKKIIYLLLIAFGINISGINASANPSIFAIVDVFVKACIANNDQVAITLYNQHKEAYLVVEEKKISIEALLLSAIDLKTQTNSLMYAVHHQNMRLIHFFLEHQAKVENELKYKLVDYKNNTGCTALHLAARKGNKAIVGLLLQNGANPNLTDMASMTALHGAVLANNPEIVTMLLEAGIDASVRDAVKKMTAKDVAIILNREAELQAFAAFENKK